MPSPIGRQLERKFYFVQGLGANPSGGACAGPGLRCRWTSLAGPPGRSGPPFGFAQGRLFSAQVRMLAMIEALALLAWPNQEECFTPRRAWHVLRLSE